jgi:hypothetical protein
MGMAGSSFLENTITIASTFNFAFAAVVAEQIAAFALFLPQRISKICRAWLLTLGNHLPESISLLLLLLELLLSRLFWNDKTIVR